MIKLSNFNFNVHVRFTRLALVVCGIAVVIAVAAGSYSISNTELTHGSARFISADTNEIVGEPSTGELMILSIQRDSLGFADWVANPLQDRVTPARSADEHRYGALLERNDTAGELGGDVDILRSQDQAWVAVNSLLGREVASEPMLVVTGVMEGTAAEAAGIVADDRIISINGGTFEASFSGLASAMRAGSVTVEIARAGETFEVTLDPTVIDGAYGAKNTLGFATANSTRITDEDRPFLAIPRGTRGPSSGMMYALAYLDAVTEGDLTGGLRIAGTGTINPKGTVGEIGGVQVKVMAAVASDADVLIVDDRNYAEALEHAPADLPVVEVLNLKQAVRWLCENGGSDSAACDHVYNQWERQPTSSTDEIVAVW